MSEALTAAAPVKVSAISEEARVISAAVISLAAATAGTASGGAAFLMLSILLAAALRPEKILRKLLAANLFILMLWAIVPFTSEGTPAASFGPLTATREGTVVCLLATLKCNAVFLAFTSLTAGISAEGFAGAMRILRVPEKLTTLFILTARQVEVFAEARKKTSEAMRLRGFAPRASLHTYRTAAASIALLFLRASEKSRVMEEALRLRGFTGKWPVSGCAAPSRLDALFTAAAVVIAIGLHALTF